MEHNDKNKIAKLAILSYLKDYCDKDWIKDKCVLVPENADRMNEILAYCQDLSETHNCYISQCNLDPREPSNGVQLTFEGETIFSSNGSIDLVQFTHILKLCDGVNICPLDEDLFEITFFVVGMWELPHEDVDDTPCLTGDC